ncbi:MAG: MarC family protein [Sphingomonadales bacterium]
MRAFRVAGGVMLLLLALDMVFERRSARRERRTEAVLEVLEPDGISVFPMAIPMLAGPGAFTSVVLLMGEQAGKTFSDVVTRTLGILLAALAVQFIFDGARQAFMG